MGAVCCQAPSWSGYLLPCAVCFGALGVSSLNGWCCTVAGPIPGQAFHHLGAICGSAFGVSFAEPLLGGLSVRLWPSRFWPSLTDWALSVAGPFPGQTIFLLGAVFPGALGVSAFANPYLGQAILLLGFVCLGPFLSGLSGAVPLLGPLLGWLSVRLFALSDLLGCTYCRALSWTGCFPLGAVVSGFLFLLVLCVYVLCGGNPSGSFPLSGFVLVMFFALCWFSSFVLTLFSSRYSYCTHK